MPFLVISLFSSSQERESLFAHGSALRKNKGIILYLAVRKDAGKKWEKEKIERNANKKEKKII